MAEWGAEWGARWGAKWGGSSVHESWCVRVQTGVRRPSPRAGRRSEWRSDLRWVAKSALLAGRGLIRRGSRYRCLVCDTGVAAFTHQGGSLRTRQNGYCPRCNAKARHRRVWLHLQQHTNLWDGPIRLLHVAPAIGPGRALAAIPSIDWVGIDIRRRDLPTMRLDVTDMPFPSESFDAALSIHVLEHLDDDHAAMAELYRVLRPGGWAVLNFPCRLDGVTREDPSITDPDERRAAFGEADHRRDYGGDVVDRLRSHGFGVRVFPATDIDPAARIMFGLTDDEHVFHCSKDPKETA